METYLASVLDGELSSYEVVVNEHQREVWEVLGVLLLEREEATAVAKDVFIAIYEHLRQYDPKYPFRAFVRTIARQRVRQSLRDQVSSKGELPVFGAYVNKVFADDAGAAAHLHKANEQLSKFAAELPGFATQLLHRRYHLGEDFERIAKVTGRPIAAVRQMVRRAQTDLADRLLHRTREDPTGTRSNAEELTLSLLDGSIEEQQRVELERLLLAQSGEVPGHIALMEVEAWLRGRWREPKLGRMVLNAINQSLREKRVRQQGALVTPVVSDAASNPELAAMARSATVARPSRRRRRSGVPAGLIALLLAAIALVGVGWLVYKYQLGKLKIDPSNLKVTSFDGLVKVDANNKRWDPIVNLLLAPPAGAITQAGGKITLEYNPKLRITVQGDASVKFDANASVTRLVTVQSGMVTMYRATDAPGPAPMFAAGLAEVVPAKETTRLTIAQSSDGCRVDVQTGAATVTHQRSGESVLVRTGDFVVVTADAPLRTRSQAQTRRVTDGLVTLYRFAEAGGDTLLDTSGFGDALDLKLNDDSVVKRGKLALTINEPAMIFSPAAATRIEQAIKASGAVTVELWLQPAKVDQTGAIVALAMDAEFRDLVLYQGDGQGGHGDEYGLVLRTRSTGGSGGAAVLSGPGTVNTELTHVVVTHDKSGATQWYINGKAVGSPNTTQQTGDLGNWATDHPLMLGNVPSGEHPWLGTYRLLAIYDRALSESDVALNYDVALTEPMATEQPATATNAGADNAVKPARRGYMELFYLTGAGPVPTTPFTVNSGEYRIRLKLKMPKDRPSQVFLRQRDTQSDRGEQLLDTSKPGMYLLPATMGKGTYTLQLDCDMDVDWILSVEEMRDLKPGEYATPDREEFKGAETGDGTTPNTPAGQTQEP